MPHGGALPSCVIAYMLQFCGPDTVLKVACTGAWRWNTSSPEAQRQVIAARSLCAIAAGMRASGYWSSKLWPSNLRGCRYIALVAVARSGFALEDAASELRADKEVVLGAVAQNGYALQFAVSDLRADKEVVLGAVARTVTRWSTPVPTCKRTRRWCWPLWHETAGRCSTPLPRFERTRRWYATPWRSTAGRCDMPLLTCRQTRRWSLPLRYILVDGHAIIGFRKSIERSFRRPAALY